MLLSRKLFIVLSWVGLAFSSTASSQNLPGYMTPFGITLGQPLDSNLRYDRAWDPKTLSGYKDLESTNDSVDYYSIDRIVPPTPNRLFNNNAWIHSGDRDGGGTWNGYSAKVTRKSRSVFEVEAVYTQQENQPWGSRKTFSSCSQVDEIVSYFRSTYPDLTFSASDGNKHDRKYYYFTSQTYANTGIYISCSYYLKDFERVNIIFSHKPERIKNLRDHEARAENNTGF